jgi:hypothetical protein
MRHKRGSGDLEAKSPKVQKSENLFVFSHWEVSSLCVFANVALEELAWFVIVLVQVKFIVGHDSPHVDGLPHELKFFGDDASESFVSDLENFVHRSPDEIRGQLNHMVFLEKFWGQNICQLQQLF